MWYYTGYDFGKTGDYYRKGKLYYNPDETTYKWLWNAVYDSKWWISAYPGPTYYSSVHGIFTPTFYYNGGPFYVFTSGSYYLHFCSGSVYTEDAFFSTGWIVSQGLNYLANCYFNSTSTAIPPLSEYKQYVNGVISGSSFTLERKVEGFSSSSLIGEYSGDGDSMFVGWKVLTVSGGSGGDFTVSQKNQIHEEKFIYASNSGTRYIWYDGSNWILSSGIGVADLSQGYWKSSGGEATGTYELQYEGEEPPEPSSYDVSLDDREQGTETEIIYLGETAIWR